MVQKVHTMLTVAVFACLAVAVFGEWDDATTIEIVEDIMTEIEQTLADAKKKENRVPSNWESTLESAGRLGRPGDVIFEKDILIPKSLVVRAVESGTLKTPDRKKSRDKKGPKTSAITAHYSQRWKKGIVPYVVDSSLKCSWATCWAYNPEKHIENAMKAWSARTCIKFRKKTSSDSDYVKFVAGSVGVCNSYVGRVGGEQKINLGVGCRTDGIVIHEIGHALGFYHEQSRPDRDKYIRINYDNIPKKYWSQFAKYTRYQTTDMGVPYDYGSIMQYPSRAFLKFWKTFYLAKSITALQKGGSKMGQRNGLSSSDIKEANLYYQSECAKQ